MRYFILLNVSGVVRSLDLSNWIKLLTSDRSCISYQLQIYLSKTYWLLHLALSIQSRNGLSMMQSELYLCSTWPHFLFIYLIMSSALTVTCAYFKLPNTEPSPYLKQVYCPSPWASSACCCSLLEGGFASCRFISPMRHQDIAKSARFCCTTCALAASCPFPVSWRFYFCFAFDATVKSCFEKLSQNFCLLNM